MASRGLLWEPTDDAVAEANITRYMGWLRQERGLSFADYASLWQWSVDDLGGFWHSIWDFYGVHSSAPYAQALADIRMPGARWFDGAALNYAEHVLAGATDERPALVALGEAHVPVRSPGRKCAARSVPSPAPCANAESAPATALRRT